jgi:excisionase family DNA binding protein
MTVHEAARHLGISEDAVRMRVKRGTLEAEREGRRLYVLLTDEPTTEPTDRTDELVNELHDRIRYLERQVEEERTARYRADELLAQLMQRIPPQLEAPTQEPSESPETATPQPGRVEPQAPLEEAQEPSERPWWRRVFRGR